MLSELLAALMGFDGDVFVFNDKYDLSVGAACVMAEPPPIKHPWPTLQVRPGLPFVSSLEEEVLNRICRVGGYFKKLENFVLDHRSGQQGTAA